jgi:hypothetical protein
VVDLKRPEKLLDLKGFIYESGGSERVKFQDRES